MAFFNPVFYCMNTLILFNVTVFRIIQLFEQVMSKIIVQMSKVLFDPLQNLNLKPVLLPA